MTRRSRRRSQSSSQESGFAHRLWNWFSNPVWIIVLVVLLCDIGSWHHQFVLDDASYIAANHFIQTPRNALRMLVSRLVPPPSENGDMYRPLTALSFGLHYWVHCASPDSFHLINRLLQLLVCLLIYRIALRLIPQPRWAALAIALLFAAHPLQTEAVTYIDGRADELVALFFLLAWFWFLRLHETGHFSFSKYALSLLFYVLALLSKENAITWPGVALLTDLVYFSNRNFKQFLKQCRRNLSLYVGYFLASLVFLVIRAFALQQHSLEGLRKSYDLILNPLIGTLALTRILTALKILFLNLVQFCLPLHFSSDYSYNQIPLITRWSSAAGLLVLALLFLGLLLWSYRFSPHLFFGLGFFAATYSIVSNLLIPIGTIRADRLLYLPMLGLCWPLGVGWAWLYERFDRPHLRRMFEAGLAVVLVLLIARTIARNPDWKDNITLELKDIQTSPQSVKLLNELGGEYSALGNSDRALDYYFKAAVIAPNFAKTFTNIGSVYAQMKEMDKAIQYFKRALEIDPKSSATLNNLAAVYFQQRKIHEAFTLYHRALELAPEDLVCRNGYAYGLSTVGEDEQALEQYDIVISLDPRNVQAHYGKANALNALGRLGGAIEEYRRVLEIDPQFPTARNNLNVLLRKTARGLSPP